MNVTELRYALNGARESALCNDDDLIRLSFDAVDGIVEALDRLEELLRALASLRGALA